MAPKDWSVGVPEGCLVAKRLSHLPHSFFSGPWLGNESFLIVNTNNFEPSCIRIVAYMNLQYQVYTKNAYIADQGHVRALLKYRIELKCFGQPSHLADMPYYFICTQSVFGITQY